MMNVREKVVNEEENDYHGDYHFLLFGILGPPAVIGNILQNRVCLLFRLSFHLFGRFFGINTKNYFFSKFWHGCRNPCEIVRDRTRFSGKMFCESFYS